MTPYYLNTIKALAAIFTAAYFSGCTWIQFDLNSSTQKEKQSSLISASELRQGCISEPCDLSFIANMGQSSKNIRYLTKSRKLTTLLTDTELVIRPDTATPPIQIKFSDSTHKAIITALEQLPGVNNYLIDNNPENWITDVPHFAKLHYKDVYPGIDIEFYSKQGNIAFDFLVAPGQDPSAAKLNFTGITNLEIKNGQLIIEYPAGQITLKAPVIYQNGIDSRKIIPGGYQLTGQTEASFSIGKYDTSNELVIDPIITWSTYTGGSSSELASDIALDTSGNIYITGTTSSVDLPLSDPFQATLGGTGSAFVMKFDAITHDLVYSTYLGDKVQESRAIVVDSTGNAYVGGSTASTIWPTMNPIQTTNNGLIDAFVVKLNTSGNGLVYSTYIGGQGIDRVRALALDNNNRLYLTGSTASVDFPLVNAWQNTLLGFVDTWVGRINASGDQLEYSTFLGGSKNDYGAGITADASGNAYITGYTESSDFPVISPVQANSNGNNEAYIVKMNTTGSPVWSTYFGGSATDTGNAIKLTTSNEIVVAGQTNSTDFPTQNATQTSHGGITDAFLLILDNAGTAPSYSTYLGGAGGDSAAAISIANNTAYMTGTTTSTDFPLIRPVQSTYNGGVDAFVTKFDLSTSSLLYSTYLGGSGEDRGRAIATDTSGNTYISGITGSTDFPVLIPYQAANAGNTDIFLTKISDDQDDDTIPDTSDNCPTVSNSNQADFDNDGTGDLCDMDIDNDGLDNSQEIIFGTNSFNSDTDNDNLSDGDEVNLYGSNPLFVDTDGDNINDDVEVSNNTDPNDPLSFPPDGDLNGDNNVNIADVLVALRSLSGDITLSNDQIKHGDVAPFVNGISLPDGIISTGDLLGILRKALGQVNYP